MLAPRRGDVEDGTPLDFVEGALSLGIVGRNTPLVTADGPHRPPVDIEHAVPQGNQNLSVPRDIGAGPVELLLAKGLRLADLLDGRSFGQRQRDSPQRPSQKPLEFLPRTAPTETLIPHAAGPRQHGNEIGADIEGHAGHQAIGPLVQGREQDKGSMRVLSVEIVEDSPHFNGEGRDVLRPQVAMSGDPQDDRNAVDGIFQVGQSVAESARDRGRTGIGSLGDRSSSHRLALPTMC